MNDYTKDVLGDNVEKVVGSLRAADLACVLTPGVRPVRAHGAHREDAGHARQRNRLHTNRQAAVRKYDVYVLKKSLDEVVASLHLPAGAPCSQSPPRSKLSLRSSEVITSRAHRW